MLSDTLSDSIPYWICISRFEPVTI